MQRGLFAVLILLGVTGKAVAQCEVSSDSNEGKLLALYTAPIVFSMAGPPEVLPSASLRLGVEGEYIPKPSPEIEQTGACFTQKSEHTSLSPVFGRPRITVGGPFGFALEAAYLPPVIISRATPNLFSFAVSYAHHYGFGSASGMTGMLRFHGTYGNVKGPSPAQRPASAKLSIEPVLWAESVQGHLSSGHVGGEIAAGFAPGGGGLSLYGGVGANRIDPHFQVGFTDGNGNVDQTQVQLENAVTRTAVFGGITQVFKGIFDIGAQIYSVPADATLLRLMGGIRIH
jgi:hypothetical protein